MILEKSGEKSERNEYILLRVSFFRASTPLNFIIMMINPKLGLQRTGTNELPLDLMI